MVEAFVDDQPYLVDAEKHKLNDWGDHEHQDRKTNYRVGRLVPIGERLVYDVLVVEGPIDDGKDGVGECKRREVNEVEQTDRDGGNGQFKDDDDGVNEVLVDRIVLQERDTLVRGKVDPVDHGDDGS